MSKPTIATESAQTPVRPFPWFCPHCRRKQVRRTTIPYQCSRVYNGQPITVVVQQLSVPCCDNCGELVFDYVAEEQINEALRAHTAQPAEHANGPVGEPRDAGDFPKPPRQG